MPSSVTLRSGRDLPIAETAVEVAEQLRQSDDDDLIAVHIDGSTPARLVYIRVGEVALVIDTPPPA